MQRNSSRRANRARNRRTQTILAALAVPAVVGAGIVVAPPLAAMLVEIDPVEEARKARLALEAALDARSEAAGKGMTTTWFDSSGELLSIATGGSFVDSERDAPSAAASYNAQGRISAKKASNASFRVTDDAACQVEGQRIARTGTTVRVPDSGHLGFRCASTASSGTGLEIRTGGAFTPVARAALRPGAARVADAEDGPVPSRAAPTALGAKAFDDWGTAANEPEDSDADDIPNTWELDGYTVEQKSSGVVNVVKWDDRLHAGAHDPWGNPYLKYVSSPLKASTNNDPYSDYSKVTTVGLLPGISAEARHPLVTAMPEVEIDMESFRLIKNEDWSSSSGGENRIGVTQTTSAGSSRSNTAGGQTECQFSVKPVPSVIRWGCSVSANYSHTWGSTNEYTDSKENSSTETWNDMISGSTSKAAILLPSMRYKNVGTHPIADSEPKFTIALGDQELVSGISNQANNLSSANPGETYPAAGSPALAFQSINDFATPITIDEEIYRQMQFRHPRSPELRVVTNSFDGAIPLVDDNGIPTPSYQTWAGMRNSVLATNATLIVEKPDGTTEKRYIAAKGSGVSEATVPSLTLGESLALTHGAKQRGEDWYIGGNKIDPDSYEFTMTAETNDRLAEQAIEDIFDLRLEAGMVIAIKEIAPAPEPDDWTVTRGHFAGTSCETANPGCEVTLNLPPHYGTQWGSKVSVVIGGRELELTRNKESAWYFNEHDVAGKGYPTGELLELNIDGELAGVKMLPAPLSR